MKKVLTALLSVTVILSLVLCLSGCSVNEKQQEAIDAFNTTSASFNEVATLINNNSDAIDDEIISTFQEMSALLTQYKDILEGDGDITDEKYDEMIKWFSDVQTWSKDAKTDIETALTNAQA
jgi:predicted DNA-binding protein YlxM (UPF0122 family)